MNRLPLLTRIGLPANSRVRLGKLWPAPAEARRVEVFHIYRDDPDTGERPRLDTFEIDLDACGPLVLKRRTGLWSLAPSGAIGEIPFPELRRCKANNFPVGV